MFTKSRLLLAAALAVTTLFSTTTLAQQTVVGSTPAEFTVSGGGASYSIPIQVAPGRGGMQPDLSLNYTGGGNGVLGVGWSLGGLSSIHRCPANLDQDGFIAGITFTDKDRYCLDGQRLIPVSGVNGGVGTEYRTEIDGYAQIKSYGGSLNNPSYFIAKTKAGQVITFGGGAGNSGYASVVFPQGISAWGVRTINDSTGNNPITYTYIVDQNTQYLEEVSYANGNVEFIYENRPDVRDSYFVGHLIRQRNRIASIQVYGDQQGQVIKSYLPTYENVGFNGHSRVSALGLCVATECLSDISFGWETSPYLGIGSGWQSRSPNSGTGFGISNCNLLTPADMNGDGLTDLVCSYRYGDYSTTTFVQLSTTNGLGGWQAWSPNSGTGFGLTNCQLLTPADMNGDGLTDLVCSYRYGDYSTTTFVQLSTGSSLGGWQAWSPNSGTGFGTSNCSSLTAEDMNGDGLTDLVCPYRYGDHSSTTFVQLSTGSGLSGWQAWSPNSGTGFGISNCNLLTPADMNGDGLTDLVCPYRYGDHSTTTFVRLSTGSGLAGWQAWSPNSGTGFGISNCNLLTPADMNGDGLTDLVCSYRYGDYSTTTFVQLSTGSSLGGWQAWSPNSGTGFGLTNCQLLTPADMNGDGLTDLVCSYRYGDYSTTTFVQLSTGSGLGSWQAWSPNSGTGFGISNCNSLTPADINGDGLTDLVCPYRYGDHSSTTFVQLTSANMPLLKKITHNNSEISLAYKSLIDSTVYTKGTGAQYPVVDLQYPQYVVSSVESSNGVGGTSTVHYHYEGLKAHARGRGSYGYAKITESYPDTGKTLETFYNHTGFPLVGNVDRVVEKLNGQIINESNKTFVVSNTHPDVYAVNLDQSVDKSYELNGNLITTVTTDYSNIDNYGNIGTVSVSTTGNGETFTKTTNSTYTNDLSHWYLGRLTETTVTHQAPGQTNQQRRSQFSYDGTTGLLTTESVMSISTGLPLSTTTYQYDAYGHKTQTTVSAASETDRTSTTTYNTEGRPTQACNALNQCETTTYTPEGWVASMTGPNSITTSWEYDGFGRKTKETRADGTETTVARHFSSSGSCGVVATHAHTCSISHTTGSQPATVQYDTLGREVRKIATGFDGRLIYSDTEYNAQAQVTRVSRNYFMGDQVYWANSQYDALGRVTHMDEPAPHGTRNIIATAYNGLTTTVTSGPEQRQKTTITNAIGQVIHRGEEEGSFIDYTYTADGNLQTTTVAGDSSTTITLSYDEFGRKIGMGDPDMGIWSYTYNAFGQLISQTDAKNQTTTMQYDSLGRLVSRTEPDGTGTTTSTWVYGDANDPVNPAPQGSIGKLLSETNGSITKTYFYDSLGRPDEVNTDMVGEPSFNTQTLYDSLGRVSRTLYPGSDNFYTENLYNANGFLEKVRGLRSSSEQYDLSILTPLVSDAVSLAAEYNTKAQSLSTLGQQYQAKIAEYQALMDTGTTNGSLDSSLQTSLTDHQTLLNDTVTEGAGFDNKPIKIFGTSALDNIEGTSANEWIYSGGTAMGVESIRGNGGSDRLIFNGDDTFPANSANDANGHFRVRDFVIANIATNSQADVLDIIDFLQATTAIDANNIGNYLHVISNPYGYSHTRTGVFVNREGDFTSADRAALNANVVVGGHGADLYLEFQGQGGNNNFATLTGHADNTVAQFQALIDMGFLDLSGINPTASQAHGGSFYDHLNNTLVELQTVTDLINEQVHTYENTVEQLIVLAEQTLAAADNSFQYERTLTRGGVAYTELVNDTQYTNYWTALDVDASGRISAEVYGNGIVNDYTYNQATGQLQQLHSSLLTIDPIRHLEYQYDAYQNVTTREDHANDIRETFEYDRLDRLTRTDITSATYISTEFNGSQTQSYDAFGNITHKSDVGAYTYGQNGAGPHAVTTAGGNTYQYDANGNMTSGDNRTITWSSFNKPTLITKGTSSASFAYGADRARYKKVNHAGHKTLYVGKLYEHVTKGTDVEEKHYIYANGQLVAEHIVSTAAGVQTRYLHKDALGSVDLVTDATANVVDRRSFDAWGKLRNLTWKDSEGINNPLYLTQLPFTNKGFTGHESIQEVGLIHMNGRVYDATLARFLSADPHIQAGSLSQSYNRYSYVINNPMKYTDPTGYLFGIGSWVKRKVKSVEKAVKKYAKPIVAIALAVVTYGAVSTWASGLVYGQAVAGMTAAQLSAIGASGAFWGAVAGGAAAGFVAGASLTALNGGSGKQALRSGFKGAVSGAITGGVAGSYGDAWSWQRVGASSLAGGVSSEVQGGEFKDGFRFTLATSMLTYANYEMRRAALKNSSYNPRNVDGDSAGFLGVNRKLAGAREVIDPNGVRLDCVSMMGGCQGAPIGLGDTRSSFFGTTYSAGSLRDTINESFAGPHDWFRNATGSYITTVNGPYDIIGNGKYLTGFNATIDSIKNYGLVVPAAPFAIAGLIESSSIHGALLEGDRRR